MLRRVGIVWIAIAAIIAASMCAYAMPVRIEGGALTATVVNAQDGSPYALNSSDFHLLGTDDTGMYLIFDNGQFLKISKSAISLVIDSLDANDMFSLPSITQFHVLSRGSRGDEVISMQNDLRRLDYMSGNADGDYGGQSERAISEFQKRMGLTETGVADELTQMLLRSMTQGRKIISANTTPIDRFAIISGKTEANLDKAAEFGMSLNYDDISGTGMITNGASISYNAPAYADIDQRAFTLSFGLKVDQQQDGVVAITPALELTCTGVQRPIMQEITLKSGDERYTIPVEGLTNSLSGLRVVEKGTALLSMEAAEMLANAADEGELKIRINCKYNSYDVVAPSNALEGISQVGEVALGLEQ